MSELDHGVSFIVVSQLLRYNLTEIILLKNITKFFFEFSWRLQKMNKIKTKNKTLLVILKVSALFF